MTDIGVSHKQFGDVVAQLAGQQIYHS